MADLMAEYINAISVSEPADRNRLMAFGTSTVWNEQFTLEGLCINVYTSN